MSKAWKTTERKPWVDPTEDPNLNLKLAIGQDPKDPRALGEGPCGNLHLEALTPRATKAPVQAKVYGNAYARWMDCRACGMRLLYWPKGCHTGRYRRQSHPEIVREALDLMKKDHHNLRAINGKVVRSYINKVEADLKVQRVHYPDLQVPLPKDQTEDGSPSQNGAPRPNAKGNTRRAASRARSSGTKNVPEPKNPMDAEQIPAAPSDEEEDQMVTLKELRETIFELKRENKGLSRRLQEVGKDESVSQAS